MAWQTPSTVIAGSTSAAAWANIVVNDLDYMYSTIPFTVSSSKPIRVLETVYQNTTDHAIWASVSVKSSGVSTQNYVDCAIWCNSTATPSTTIIGSPRATGSILSATASFTFILLSTYYYAVHVVQSSPGSALDYWQEWR